MRSKQQKNFNRRHQTKSLESLLPYETVWVPDHNTSGTVIEGNAPRSYTIQIPSGHFRRNRRHVISLPTATQSSTDDTISNDTPEESPHNNNGQQNDRDVTSTDTLTRSSRVSKPPDRLISSEII